jgi:hypothetical protein
MLHYAAANGHEECVAWLIKRGCKVLPHPNAVAFSISFTRRPPLVIAWAAVRQLPPHHAPPSLPLHVPAFL